MIDLREIRETIEDIKRDGTTIGAAEKLALLYIVEERLERDEARMDDGYAHAAAGSESVDVEPASDFLAACRGAPVDQVLYALDEHMEIIRVLYPREHDALLRKIKNL